MEGPLNLSNQSDRTNRNQDSIQTTLCNLATEAINQNECAHLSRPQSKQLIRVDSKLSILSSSSDSWRSIYDQTVQGLFNKCLNKINYNLLKFIGKGSLGEVFVVEETTTKDRFACKIFDFQILRQLFHQTNVEEIIINHIKTMKSQSIDEIVFYQEALYIDSNGNDGNLLHHIAESSNNSIKLLYVMLIMELCRGGTLHDIMNRMAETRKNLPERTIIQIFHQIVKGLYYLHKINKIHGDLRPDNIFIMSDIDEIMADQNTVPGGTPEFSSDHCILIKIGDIGLYHILESANIRLSNNVNSFSLYQPPEILNGGSNCSYSRDIWSIGKILLELCIGTDAIPFTKVKNPRNSDFIQNAMKERQYSPHLIGIVCRCLVIDPNFRIKTSDLIQHHIFNYPHISNIIVRPSTSHSNHKIDYIFNAVEILTKKVSDMEIRINELNNERGKLKIDNNRLSRRNSRFDPEIIPLADDINDNSIFSEEHYSLIFNENSQLYNPYVSKALRDLHEKESSQLSLINVKLDIKYRLQLEKFIQSHSQLTMLNMSSLNLVNEDLVFLESMTNLVYLDIGSNNLHLLGISHLKPLKKLEKLVLYQSFKSALTDCLLNDEDISPIKYLESLSQLVLRGNNITVKGVPTIISLPLLKELDLSYNLGFLDEGITQLSNNFSRLSNLNRLEVQCIGMTDIGLEQLTNCLVELPNIKFIGILGDNLEKENLISIIDRLNESSNG